MNAKKATDAQRKTALAYLEADSGGSLFSLLTRLVGTEGIKGILTDAQIIKMARDWAGEE